MRELREKKKDYLNKLIDDKNKLSRREQEIYGCDERISKLSNEISNLESKKD